MVLHVLDTPLPDGTQKQMVAVLPTNQEQYIQFLGIPLIFMLNGNQIKEQYLITLMVERAQQLAKPEMLTPQHQ